MIILCDKCKKSFNKSEKGYWISGVTFEGIDRHHNPPEEIYRFLKLKWNGEFFNLCRKCHQGLHKEITLILKKYSNVPKYNSDYWLMKNSTLIKIIEAKEEIYYFTKEWIKKDGNTKETSG